MKHNTLIDAVKCSLSGSVSSFVAYLAERGEVSAAELRELEQLVASLEPARAGGRS